MIVPSSSIAFSAFTMVGCCEQPGAQLSADCDNSLSAMIVGKRAVSAVTTRPIFARTRFIHVERAAVEVVAIERAHRSFSLRVVVHRDECEATRFTGHTVQHQMDFVDRAVLFEQILKIVLGGLKREITYVQFHCV